MDESRSNSIRGDVNLVMGPTSRGASIPFRVYLDGQLANNEQGATWIRTAAGWSTRPAHLSTDPPTGRDCRAAVVEIEFLDAGVDAY